MPDKPIDLDAYARRIAFGGTISPTLVTLSRLVERHAAAIPFENIDVLAGHVPALDRDALQHKLVRRRRGGYCFEQNSLFLACLQQAGFAARGLEARVRAGVPTEVVTGRTHMAVCVTLQGDDYLADVGFGGLAPLAPLKLDSREPQDAGGSVYRFVDADGDRLLQVQTDEGWSDCYRLSRSQPQYVDYEIGNWYVATHPKAMLGHNLLVARAVAGGRLMLFNRQLSRRRTAVDKPEEQTLGTRGELEDVLADGFGLHLDAADLDAVMAVLERLPAA